MGHIFFVLWVSGSWKWTLIKNLKKLDLKNIHFPISYKTREIRKNEINWVDSYFISKEEFFSQVQAGKFLEYAIVHETEYYWTKFEDIIDNWINKQKIVIKEIDINWLEELQKKYPELDNKYTTIFLNISQNILKDRIKKRWIIMTQEELQRRINSSIFEIQKAEQLCNHIIDATLEENKVLNIFLDIFYEKLKNYENICKNK